MRKFGIFALTALFVAGLAMPAAAGCSYKHTQQSMADASTQQSTSSDKIVVGTDGN